MPNHVTTRCTVYGAAAEIAAFKARMLKDEPVLHPTWHPDERLRGQPTGEIERRFDFNAVIPMPAILRETESGSDTSFGLFALGEEQGDRFAGNPLTYRWVQELGISSREEFRAWLEKDRPGAIEKAKLAIEAKRLTGHADWYSWSVENWGTKWNAYNFQEVTDADGEYEFLIQTAWSFPKPVFEAIAAVFPALRFWCRCFDEGWGFAGDGWFNGRGPQFRIVEATDALYGAVYGERPARDAK